MRLPSAIRGAAFVCFLGSLGAAAVELAGCALECTEMGCDSGVSALVHIDASPAAIAEGALEVCHQGACTRVRAEPAPGASGSWSLRVESGETLVHGTLEAEGAGSLVRAFFAHIDRSTRSPAELADGDRIRIRATDRAGAVLAEHSRPVTYESSTPNGAACGPTCRVAAVELWPASASDVACPSTFCEAGLDVSTTVQPARELAGRARSAGARSRLERWARPRGGLGTARPRTARSICASTSTATRATSAAAIDIASIGAPPKRARPCSWSTKP
jgi:hypothetical protein